jgi:hypothetical protein
MALGEKNPKTGFPRIDNHVAVLPGAAGEDYVFGEAPTV